MQMSLRLASLVKGASACVQREGGREVGSFNERVRARAHIVWQMLEEWKMCRVAIIDGAQIIPLHLFWALSH